MNRLNASRRAGLLVVAAALLAGCATLNSVVSEVSSFGPWPAGRAPGSYAFERLPSQQARAADVEPLEQSARAALEKAGFTAVAAGQQPDVLVQVGMRVSRSDPSPWDDAIWWRGGFGHYRRGPWLGPGWGIGYHVDLPRYEREVALLLRDRATGQPLFEAHASNEGNGLADSALVGAMFSAALADFPQIGVNPRRVTVALPAP